MGFFGSLGRAMTAPGRHVMGTVSRGINRLPGGNALSRGVQAMGGGALGIRTRDQSQHRTQGAGERSNVSSAARDYKVRRMSRSR